MKFMKIQYYVLKFGNKVSLIFISHLIVTFNLLAQQVPDSAYNFQFITTSYPKGGGPLILIDEAHNNFHTKGGGFFAFSKLLEQDGYLVGSLNKSITNPDLLKASKILVIANPLNARNINNWVLPTPTAFTTEEIEIIHEWVNQGGKLLLIADHMPFAGAAYELGKAFGFEFINGFAFTSERSWPPSVFLSDNGTLKASPVTIGNNPNENIDKISTFTGSAFKAPTGSIPILSFTKEHYSLQPDTAWRFNGKTPKIDLDGCCQGAIMEYGKGKIAVFGEAAMFTAQLVNSNVKVGINSEFAPQNAQFTLNLIHWLDCGLKGKNLK